VESWALRACSVWCSGGKARNWLKVARIANNEEQGGERLEKGKCFDQQKERVAGVESEEGKEGAVGKSGWDAYIYWRGACADVTRIGSFLGHAAPTLIGARNWRSEQPKRKAFA
jgi:hypothetical protein